MYKSLVSISLMATVLTACGGGGSGGSSPSTSSLSSSAVAVVSSIASSVVSSVEQSSAPSSEVVSSVSSVASQTAQSSVPVVPSSVAVSSVSSAAPSSSTGVVQSSAASSEPAPTSSVASEQSSHALSSEALSSEAVSESSSSEISSSQASSSEADASSSSVSSAAESSATSVEVSSIGESSVASSQASSDSEGPAAVTWAPSAQVFKLGGSTAAITGSVSTGGADSTSFAITGGKFESSKEAFFFANQFVSGDFVFTANISSWASGTRSGSDQGSVGLLLCDNCDTTMASVPASAKIGVRDNGIIHTERLSSGASLTKTNVGNSLAPSNQLYLRITRTGNQVALAYSNDGGANYDTVRTSSFTSLSNNLRLGIYAAQGTEANNSFVVNNISLLANGQANGSSSESSNSSGNSSVSSTGQASSVSSQNGAQSSAGTSSNASQGQSSSSVPYVPVDVALSNACINLVTNPSINWRDTELQSDQDIVKCLYDSLGTPVGYGENAKGGYDAGGNSKLTVITKSSSVSVEQQLIDALTDNNHNWVVFDKLDFANESEIGMYRTYCSNPTVLTMLDANETECVDYWQWCERKGFSGEAKCREEFFNKQMNNKDIPIRIPAVGSNKTLDGRMSKAYFMFSGFAIGKDSAGVSTQKSTSVIFTHLDFRGAGHTEDHYVDPDMIRSTGESQDIWIHKNTFDTTGDSAFDVKVGARNITMSFNRLVNVKRAVLHGSSDSRVINSQITTTMHHNAFVTTDDSYKLLGNGLRRVPLLRRGATHMTNNVFINYRKEVLSLRVGAKAWLQDNAFVINRSHQEKSSLEASLSEIQNNLFKDIDGGSLRNDGNTFWFFTGDCVLDMPTQMLLTATSGTVDDLSQNYSIASRNALAAWHFGAGQELVDYVSATAGKYGREPFNAVLSPDRVYMEGLARGACQP